jgi:hypothetical protein
VSGRDDDGARTKNIILARRARFLGVALASAGLAIASEGCDQPRPCLSMEPASSASPTPCLKAPNGDPLPQPSVCLEVEMPDASDAGASDAGVADTGKQADATKRDAGLPRPQPTTKPQPLPRPCLSPVRERPKVCLSQRPPDKNRNDI